jgi:HPt (histidine-containing phosphotransfer) domain-containing protein
MHSEIDDNTIRVEIDRELQPIIPSFLECRRKDCENIARLLEDGGMREIEMLGHRLKGTGGSYGFDAISDIGIALELAAANQNREAIVEAARMLQQYLERVTIVYV